MTAAKPKDAPEQPASPLLLLRKPFADNHISKLPKETRAQIDERKSNKDVMVFNCPVCGGHHHKKAVHLDYVGHAALTDRLLDTDVQWSWEPVAFTQEARRDVVLATLACCALFLSVEALIVVLGL